MMQALNMDIVQEYMKSKNYENLMNYFFEVLSHESETDLSYILDGILDLVQKKNYLTAFHLDTIKQYFSHHLDLIQESAMDVYFNSLQNQKNLFELEVDFCLIQIKNFDPLIRNRFIDFFVEEIPNQSSLTDKILSALIDALFDDMWEIRIKMLQSFSHLLQNIPEILIPHNREFLKLLNEPDSDVLAEALDFLYNLILKTYDEEDLQFLLTILQDRNWFLQERILWLMGKLGRNNFTLISPFIPNLIKLLDHDELALQQRVGEMFAEIMLVNPRVFDDYFFMIIEDDSCENIEQIENLLACSVKQLGSARYIELFEKYGSLEINILQTFSNILRYLIRTNEKLIEQIVLQLIQYVFSQNMAEISKQFAGVLSFVPQFNIYLIVFNELNKIQEMNNGQLANELLKLKELLVTKIPEISFQNLSNWLKDHFKLQDKITIKEILTEFKISQDKLYEILEILTKRDLIDVFIDGDFIQKPLQEEFSSNKPDLKISKKWGINFETSTQIPEFTFFVRIENDQKVNLEDIRIILVNPGSILANTEKNGVSSTTYNIPLLKPGEESISSWSFIKNQKNYQAKVSYVKLVIFYKKEDKIFTLTKKLDILCA